MWVRPTHLSGAPFKGMLLSSPRWIKNVKAGHFAGRHADQRFGPFPPPLLNLRRVGCRDVEAACEAVGEGAGRILLGDLRLLGMRPCVALVDDVH